MRMKIPTGDLSLTEKSSPFFLLFFPSTTIFLVSGQMYVSLNILSSQCPLFCKQPIKLLKFKYFSIARDWQIQVVVVVLRIIKICSHYISSARVFPFFFLLSSPPTTIYRMQLYFLRLSYLIKRKKKFSFCSYFSLLFLFWLGGLYSPHMGSSLSTQGAIFRLFAPILLFSHLCLYLLYIVFCVHRLSHYSHFLQLCSLLQYRKIADFSLHLSLHEICVFVCCHLLYLFL